MARTNQNQAGAGNTAPAIVADPHADVREVLRLHGLPHAWQDEAGNVHFSADYVATLPADSLTLITAE